ncbi:hypothetical protein [Haladaptatus sp. DFWS20]|uniref:hypothetical protein n=1 Tax=Haladaptatus sp. DFWS20 TaxID=3403467 RepID=UPI003EBAC16A
MNPRVKASLLWGVVGVLAFLVLLQGYELYSGYRYAIGLKVGTTLLVAVGTMLLTYVADGVLD